MTEEEARSWIVGRYGVSRETQLQRLVALVREESQSQNLIARSTLDSMWVRHVVDSAQLLALATDVNGTWIDIGTGAGFPGLVIAILRASPITLVEPRKRRAEFLRNAIQQLDLGHADVVCAKVEAARANAAILSARAVAPLPAVFGAAAHLSDSRTRWLLPKGRSAMEEVEAARMSWQGTFHVEQSLTQPNSMIVVAQRVSRR